MICFLHRGGRTSYYAKYNKDDSYGMMDIYKLEVFTDLHPRKFILNGISRVEGKSKFLCLYGSSDKHENG